MRSYCATIPAATGPMTRLLLAGAFAISALAAAVPAGAQGTDAAGDDGDRRRRALMLLDESSTLYEQGRFREAADMLRRAHELFPEPSLLHNLGRALESAGDEEGALDAYARYLEAEPASERRPQIEARMATLERELALERRAQEGGRGGEGEGLGAEQGEPEVDEGPSLVGPVVLLASGGAALVGGLAFGIAASARQDDALEPGVSMEAGATIDDEAHSLSTVANALFVVGGVAAAAGLGWLLLSSGDDEAGEGDAPVALRLEVGPAALGLRGHF